MIVPTLIAYQTPDHSHYVRMIVTDNGQPTGTAESWFAIDGAGSLSEVISGRVGEGAVIERNSYDRNGRPIARIYTYETRQSKQVLQLTYGKRAVTLETLINGKKQKTKIIPIPRSANLASKAVFWLKRDKPPSKASITWDALNIETLKWSKATIRYLGPEQIKLDRGFVKGYKIIGPFGIVWENARGESLMLQVFRQGHTYRYIGQ